MSVDVEALTRRWQRSWPQCPPLGDSFKYRMHDRWVRFHSLPRGQRYATNATEYQIVLHRYNAILDELTATEVYLITAEYAPDDCAAGTEPVHVGLHPGAVKWMHAVDPDDPEYAYDLHVSQRRFEPGSLDELLRYVADDRAPGVVITDTALRWLYHPYDGGTDVVLPSTTERDRLRARLAEWLPTRADGL
jgi:hypothetical protein